MVTGSTLEESEKAVELAMAHRMPSTPTKPDTPLTQRPANLIYATIGIHPCSATSFTNHPTGASSLLSSLRTLALAARSTGHAVAFGEIGLDYDRLFLTDKATQLTYFEQQLDLATELQMPLFLHSRAAAADFARLLRPRLESLPRRGLVHSFTGTVEEMRELVGLGLHIGVNGCSLKTAENLAVVKEIPLSRLQIETDGPWCEIRPSHAGAGLLDEGAPEIPRTVKKERWAEGCMVKGRNEPCTIGRVAHVVARVKGVGVEEVAGAAWRNSVGMFGLGEGEQEEAGTGA